MNKLVAIKTYDYWTVRTDGVRISYGTISSPYEADVVSFSSAPEYGKGMILALGFKVKKDGTRGRQLVKPLIPLAQCPAEVRDAFGRAGYGQG